MEESGPISLSLLQNRVKRDPAAYRVEFDRQWDHFLTTVGLLQVQPQKLSKEFGELVMFVAQTSHMYEQEVSDRFIKTCKPLLKEPLASQLHQNSRRQTVYALRLLNNRGRFSSMEAMSIWFDMFQGKDKELRHELMTHIVRDITRLAQHGNATSAAGLQKFLMKKVQSDEKNRSRRAAAVLMELHRKRVWCNPGLVNCLANACLHSDTKLAAACANFLLGNKLNSLEEEEDDEDDSLNKMLSQAQKGIVGAKKTGARVKRLVREKASIIRRLGALKTKVSGLDGAASSAAIECVHDAQNLCNKLLKRIRGKHGSFNFRMIVFSLIGRLMYSHKLQTFDFFSLLQAYLRPKQAHVTLLLAAFAQSVHEQIPPLELKPVIDTITNSFVSEDQPPEIICVGLNTLREVILRNEVAVTPETVTTLMQFVHDKNKGVVTAARGLLNIIREVNPILLPKLLRGRAAAVALQMGDESERQFGSLNHLSAVPGVELLAKAKMLHETKRASRSVVDQDSASEDEGKVESNASSSLADGDDDSVVDGEEASDDSSTGDAEDESDVTGTGLDGSDSVCGEPDMDQDEDADLSEHDASREPHRMNKRMRKRTHQEAAASDAALAVEWSSNHILSQEDFRRIKKLRVAAATSSKRLEDENAFDLSKDISSSSESDSDDEDKKKDKQLVVTAESITTKFRSASKEARQSTRKQEKVGESMIAKKKADQRKAAADKPKPNSVNHRGTPMMMQIHSRRVKQKAKKDFKEKVKTVRKHIRKIKKKTGEKKRWRKG